MKAPRAPRAAFLATLLCLTGAVASAQTAVNAQGDVGLFTIPTAQALRPGQFTLGLYGTSFGRLAGNLPFSTLPEENRSYRHWAETFSLGVGITDWLSIYASTGAEQYKSSSDWIGGSINGLPLLGEVDSDESQKISVVSKIVMGARELGDMRFQLWFGARIPATQGDIRLDEATGTVVTDQINSRRSDWIWGGGFTRGPLTAIVSYQLSGDHDLDLRTPNQLRFGLGLDFPLSTEGLHILGEIDRTIYDGGDFDQPNQSTLIAGARYFIGRTGLAATGGLAANLDMLFGDGGPSVGGVLGVSYSPFPPPPPPPVTMPPPAPVEAPIEEAPAPGPASAPPPAPVPQTTTDEIQFDAGSARLTNIAKAILDGIALRMKNDLNATAVITGFSDNSGSEESNMAVSARRADAAKEYLVTRHGIDPGRISTLAKGSAEPAYDNSTAEGRAKNRRALIVVTLVSGT